MPGSMRPPTPRPRVRRRRLLARDRDGRRPAPGAVLRHLEPGVGERDRADPRLPRLGYWLGGRLADRHPTPQALGCVVLFAARHDRDPPVRDAAALRRGRDAFASVSAGAFVASFVGTLLMFALPVTALGAVSPWAIRLAVTDIARGRRGGGAAVRAVDARLDRRDVPARPLPDPGDRHAAHAVARRARTGTGGAARPAAPGGAGAGAAGGAAAGAAGPGEGGAATARSLFEGESPYQFVQVVRSRTATPCCT